ncbi:twitching motility protein PilT [Salinibacterium sp. CAN_S4]|uniref:type IV pilus twitching motility protein PilT n=1 Tax=Salinibacterium sp. CAN_S4 TaxID=2787727 RepID=UPI001A3546AF
MSKPVYEIPSEPDAEWPNAGGRRRAAAEPLSFDEIMRPRGGEGVQDAAAAAPAPGPSVPPVNMPAPGYTAPPAPVVAPAFAAQPAPMAAPAPGVSAAARLAAPPVFELDAVAPAAPSMSASPVAHLAPPVLSAPVAAPVQAPVAPMQVAPVQGTPAGVNTREALTQVLAAAPAAPKATLPTELPRQAAPVQQEVPVAAPRSEAPTMAYPQQAPPAPPRQAEVAPAAAVSPGAPAPGDGQEGSDPRIVQALNAVVIALASDLHVSAGAPPMIRVDGGLRPIAEAPVWDPDDLRAALYSIMSEAQHEIFERELELDFAYTLSDTARFRVNIYQQREALGGAFRLIPTEIKQLHELGVPDTVGNFAKLPRGLVLVTGPTGSGKSTTLAALVDLVNRTRADHIMTVEDPIEFLHTNRKSLVNQREVGHDTHSFGAALKHVLRQDPDVILVGELRDLETISVALTAAETGHLVFATLHTQDAGQTIDRMIDVFPPHQQGQVRTQLAATLQGVVCQTLVKRASGRGRVVATEVLVTTPAVANLIREGKTYQIATAMQAGRALGMHTMDQHLAELVNEGLITSKAAMEKAQDADALQRLVHRVDMSAAPEDFNASDRFEDTLEKGRH